MVFMFSLKLLLLYKIVKAHMFATKTVGSCVCCTTPLGYVLGSIFCIYILVFLLGELCSQLLDHFDTVTI